MVHQDLAKSLENPSTPTPQCVIAGHRNLASATTELDPVNERGGDHTVSPSLFACSMCGAPHGQTQLQPLVLPQLGQAWHEPARFIWTPHCMHIGASL